MEWRTIRRQSGAGSTTNTLISSSGKPSDEVTLFQLCYGIDSSDRALVWDKRRGFFHDGPPAPDEVVARFDDAATALPEDIRAEIREKIHEFAGRRISVTSRRKAFRRAAWQR